jgi:hypothetical protein
LFVLKALQACCPCRGILSPVQTALPPKRRRAAPTPPRPPTPTPPGPAVENSSDSVTQWRDDAGALWERATDANSLLAVLAEGWEHRVTPVRRGSRAIIKLIYTSSTTKLPAFHANLAREAFAKG